MKRYVKDPTFGVRWVAYGGEDKRDASFWRFYAMFLPQDEHDIYPNCLSHGYFYGCLSADDWLRRFHD